MESKGDEHIRKMKAKLDEWKAEIDKLTAGAKHADPQTEIEYERKLKELEKKAQELQNKILALQDQGESSWQDFKEGMDNSWKIFKGTLSKAKSEFKHGYKEGKD